MQTEHLSIDDVIIKTTEALIGAGLKNNSAWGHYHKFYVMLSRYQHSIGIAGYDLGAIDSFMKKQEGRCHVGEISARELRNIRRARQGDRSCARRHREAVSGGNQSI